MLGDAAGLPLGDAALADGVQQAGLAVVHVAHDGDHRGPGLHILLRIHLVHALVEHVLGGFGQLLLHLDAVFAGDQGAGVKIDLLVDGSHDSQDKQLFDDLRRRLADLFAQFLDGHHLGGEDGLFDDHGLRLVHLLLFSPLFAPHGGFVIPGDLRRGFFHHTLLGLYPPVLFPAAVVGVVLIGPGIVIIPLGHGRRRHGRPGGWPRGIPVGAGPLLISACIPAAPVLLLGLGPRRRLAGPLLIVGLLLGPGPLRLRLHRPGLVAIGFLGPRLGLGGFPDGGRFSRLLGCCFHRRALLAGRWRGLAGAGFRWRGFYRLSLGCRGRGRLWLLLGRGRRHHNDLRRIVTDRRRLLHRR